MRIVVAGSSGLIGSALVPALREHGHEVVRLVRRPPRAPDELRWDPPAGEVPALGGAGAVVNLCGAPIAGGQWTNARKQVLLDSRTVPTEVLATAVAQQDIPVQVNGSAVGFYGHTGSRAVDESARSGDDFLAGLCRRWEAATAPAADAGARVATVRTGLVMARRGGLLAQLRPVFSLMLGARLGNGRQFMPWISVDDEVGAIRHVLEHDDVSGPVNLTAPEPVTNAEFTRTLGAVLGRPAPWWVPAAALRVPLGELADTMLLSGQRAMPAVLRAHGYRFAHPSLAVALRAVLRG